MIYYNFRNEILNLGLALGGGGGEVTERRTHGVHVRLSQFHFLAIERREFFPRRHCWEA